MPSRYQPTERVIDNRDRLRELYCDRELTIREIAMKHAEVGRTRISEALREYGIKSEGDTESQEMSADDAYKSSRGSDPPTWTDVQ